MLARGDIDIRTRQVKDLEIADKNVAQVHASVKSGLDPSSDRGTSPPEISFFFLK